MTNKKNNIELLAPAGSFESMRAAIDNGADAVYFGVGKINMRSKSAINFSLEDLKEISKLCRAKKIKTYLTVNTVLYDEELQLVKKTIDAAKKNKIDAVIVSDSAAMIYAHSINMSVHISTQLSVSNIEAVKFYSQFADQIVLARELNLTRIKKITQEIKKQKITGPKGELIKIEAFAHGALCIGISGRCGMSLFSENMSANRGACRQMCRRKYKATDIETGQSLVIDNQYIMSPKDICTIGFLPQFLDTGIFSLKIEGRGRSPEYVATVIKTYRQALDSIKNKTYNLKQAELWEKELSTVFNRGMSDGYYLGKPLHEWAASSNSQATEEKFFAGIVTHYFPKAETVEIQLQAQDIKVGDKFSISGKTTGLITGKINSIFSEDAKKITQAKKNQLITIKLEKLVRKNDKFYIIKPRKNFN
jgi:U32 family peptidase